MELILINSGKLKVMLTPDDMASYSLTCDTIDYDNTETRRAFWDILDAAKHKTGFDAASDRVFIQVYPSKNGGCEMFVTKVIRGDDNEKSDTLHQISLKVKRPGEIRSGMHDIYSFDSLDNLLDVCRHLSLLDYDEDSCAYVDNDKDRYYLVLKKGINNRFIIDKSITEYSFINEYGVRRVGTSAYPYIIEHCKCICKDEAVKVLAELA